MGILAGDAAENQPAKFGRNPDMTNIVGFRNPILALTELSKA
jgi:hypothetical protein